MHKEIQARLSQATRIVVKIGTNALMKASEDTYRKLDIALVRELSRQIVQLQSENKECIVVSSGAIGFGANELRIPSPVVDISTRQACAAIGQPVLMNLYRDVFQEFGYHCAQLLVTRKDFATRESFDTLQNCLAILKTKNVIPIINENDSVSTEEIDWRFGDNDSLSAMVAKKTHADILIMLTDIDALYNKNPRHHADALPLALVVDVDAQIAHYEATHTGDEKKGSKVGTGGMETKLHAIKSLQGTPCVGAIGLASKKNILIDILHGKNVGTFFLV